MLRKNEPIMYDIKVFPFLPWKMLMVVGICETRVPKLQKADQLMSIFTANICLVFIFLGNFMNIWRYLIYICALKSGLMAVCFVYNIFWWFKECLSTLFRVCCQFRRIVPGDSQSSCIHFLFFSDHCWIFWGNHIFVADICYPSWIPLFWSFRWFALIAEPMNYFGFMGGPIQRFIVWMHWS